MKVLRAIPITKIPSRTGGGSCFASSAFYDRITKQLEKLSAKSSLPIECQSNEECLSVQHALRWRGFTYVTRKHTVYAKGKGNGSR